MCGLKEGGREGDRCSLLERGQKHLDVFGFEFISSHWVLFLPIIF